jgi:hypothetical protein
MRPVAVSENSVTTQIQANIAFEFVTGGITLALGAAAYTGCRVSVLNSAAADVTVVSGQTAVTVKAKGSLHLEYINGTWTVVDNPADTLASILLALDHAGLANREIQKTIKQRIQSGTALIKNRGVITGCAVTKSVSAVRNLSLSTGSVFMNGAELFCPAFNNAVLIPSNNSGEPVIYYVYLDLDANGRIRFNCTAPGETIPDDSIGLYRVTVPAANTEGNDPNMANVSLTDIRRLEAGYPAQFNSLPYVSVALPFTMLDSGYAVTTEILAFRGSSNQRGTVYPGDKAANGFKLYCEGALDMVRVRWAAVKTNL